MKKGCITVPENKCVLNFDKYNKFLTMSIKNENRLKIYSEKVYNSECYFSNMYSSRFEIRFNRLSHLIFKYI